MRKTWTYVVGIFVERGSHIEWLTPEGDFSESVDRALLFETMTDAAIRRDKMVEEGSLLDLKLKGFETFV